MSEESERIVDAEPRNDLKQLQKGVDQSISVGVCDLFALLRVERAKNPHGIDDERVGSGGKLLQKLLEGLRGSEVDGCVGELDGDARGEKEERWEDVLVDGMAVELEGLGGSEFLCERKERWEEERSFGGMLGEKVLKEEKEKRPFGSEGRSGLREKAREKGEKGSGKGHFSSEANGYRLDLTVV